MLCEKRPMEPVPEQTKELPQCQGGTTFPMCNGWEDTEDVWSTVAQCKKGNTLLKWYDLDSHKFKGTYRDVVAKLQSVWYYAKRWTKAGKQNKDIWKGAERKGEKERKLSKIKRGREIVECTYKSSAVRPSRINNTMSQKNYVEQLIGTIEDKVPQVEREGGNTRRIQEGTTLPMLQ